VAAELSVIIVSYNSAAFLRRCIGSLVEQRGDLSVEVIVVDNASKDDSAATVERHFPDAVIIRNAKNLGFAKANNQGIERASGRLLLIQNPDTVTLPGLLQALVDFLAQTPEAGAASGRILNADLTDQGTARRFPTVWSGLFGRHSLLTRLLPNNRFSRRYMMTEMRGSTEPYEVDWLSTASMLVRRDVIDQVGGMREFFYWVDGEWCQRIRKGGWKIFCVPPPP
jgi:GT2 family glycosyltransferase